MDPFVAEIRIFPFNFPPKGWAFCDGQLMAISQNTALFSLVGTYYGGDGKSTFGLPNLQGSAPMFWGNGQGLSSHFIGEAAGSDNVTLLETEIPLHTHSLMGSTGVAAGRNPTDAALARSHGGNVYQTQTSNLVNLSPSAAVPAGSDFPHQNMMPYLTLNFCIALQGIFPARG